MSALAERILEVYRAGAFLMADAEPKPVGSARSEPLVNAYTADPRSIISLADDGLIISRSLRALVRKEHFTVTADRAFHDVIKACATTIRSKHQDHENQEDPQSSWISPWMINAYTHLHEHNHAHSIEVWMKHSAPSPTPMLVGGLYGVHIGGVFFGESMFSRPDLGGSNASKVALVHLWHHLRAQNFTILDTQFANSHMQQFGLIEVRKSKFEKLLAKALQTDATFGTFNPQLAPTQMSRGKST
jgi:leucyl/phenylalanyl-tRNA---protein transferase